MPLRFPSGHTQRNPGQWGHAASVPKGLPFGMRIPPDGAGPLTKVSLAPRPLSACAGEMQHRCAPGTHASGLAPHHDRAVRLRLHSADFLKTFANRSNRPVRAIFVQSPSCRPSFYRAPGSTVHPRLQRTGLCPRTRKRLATLRDQLSPTPPSEFTSPPFRSLATSR